jgi:23S rRNA (cytosine1962-C5)-methyltransferase
MPPVLTLVPNQTHRCLDGHLWVFRSELKEVPDLPAGTEVEVQDLKGRCLGRGWFSPKSQIAVRLITRQSRAVDETLLNERLDAALARRNPALPCQRLLSSEGDLLPGWIVDRYHDRLVIQSTTAAADAHQAWLVTALTRRLQPAQIVERNDLPVRDLEGVPQRAGVLHGPADTALWARIGAVEVEVDLMDPHKTGSYLDQQANHQAMAQWVRPGERVADVCCHRGGFALHALLAGAGHAAGIDQSAPCVEAATRAAQRAGVAERFAGITGDAFAWLRAEVTAKAKWDVIVLDPPSFTRNRAGVPAALRGYRDLHAQALRLLPAGGRLLTFSCSHHIDAPDYLANVVAAAADGRRTLRLDATLGANSDHPVLPAIPESQYLKGFALTVLE